MSPIKLIYHIKIKVLLLIFWKLCNVDAIDDAADEFDYIVVGGGTAGCAVARRLSENGKHSVLIIEAGGIPHTRLSVPALVHHYLAKPNSESKVYQSVVQENAGRRTHGVISYMVGRALGGTSSINGMIFNRGSPHDYNNWAMLTGDSSWKYRNLTKYFKKIEDYKGGFPSERDHGIGGPITISRPKYSPGLDEWLQAGQYVGYPKAIDPNGPQRLSFGPIEYSQKFGRRISALNGYLKPILATSQYANLKVITKSVVTRVAFDGVEATGVYFRWGGGAKSEKFVRAKREVILSAGVIGSPEILMKSGVGPKHVLDSAGIHPIKILPVGENFQDHVHIYLNFILSNRSAAFIPERDLNPKTRVFYNKFGDGPYASYIVTSQAFVVSSVASTLGIRRVWADLHFVYGQNSLPALIPQDEISISSDEVVVSSIILLSRPKSCGRVTLNANDPLNGDPLIDFQYFSHPDDMQAILDGINTTFRIFDEAPSFQKLGFRYPSVPIKACRHHPFRSDIYWRCYVKEQSASGFHGAGTCKMGKGPEDPTAVVDSQLRVIGLKNLRVVDNSIMPNVTNANTQAPAYVIAEKAADLILGHDETL